MEHLPAQADLRANFSYDRGTGAITRRTDGAPAFNNVEADGYQRGKWRGQLLRAHRVAWKMVHGVEPEAIDHINGDPADNRISNLRACTPLENQRNRRMSKNNTSGVNGVYYHKTSGTWRAAAWVDGKRKTIGQYQTIAEAANARLAFQAANGFTERHGLKNFQSFK